METPAKNKGGRPEGSANKMAREARERAQATGLLPHEILLSMARGEPQEVQAVEPNTGKIITTKVSLDVGQRMDAAKAASPYYAPKISTVEVITGVPDNELDAIIKKLTAEAGLDFGASGESTEEEEDRPTRRRARI